MSHVLSLEQASDLAVHALTASGASLPAAVSVARAVVTAHAMGRANVGFEHLPYYCEALRRGAIDGRAKPDVARIRPGLLQVDARSGFAHYAFDIAFEEFSAMAASQGAAVLTVRNTYTCGCLGYFPERLARQGCVAMAATNAGPAAVAASGSARPVFSTNPLAFALPRPDRPPLLIDQSSSACTLVDVHAARETGEPIPEDWALDREGLPTQDPEQALHGSFKPFGGYKGSNIALMVELLAAGFSGGNWSIDAPSFAEGPECPDVGQWFLAMDLETLSDGGAVERIDQYLNRLASLGAHVPGESRGDYLDDARRDGIALPENLHRAVQSYCEQAWPPSPQS